ncbi:MAG: AAA family ATPase [Oscillospiraceae bacterium]|jgi:chromosome segregation protein|nr:AAA family ATPase [Oscillospiraceae bacterium]
MYLKSLELIGFKSFPEKIKLNFEKGLTAVVGPNGSGKSNISDAMRWVLGEQSAKSLRVERMEDLIFSGTLSMKPLGYAQATITLDNSDGILNLNTDEVSVSRKYYRSGESEYLLNGRQVRLKDVVETFMDTGLGRDGYSIVGQGKITEIISSKSDERRAVFEEAAGIAKFRYKKNDAERKLSQAGENILRLNDIVSEIKTHLDPLKEQSDKAKEFLRLSDDLKEKEVSFSVQKLEELKTNLKNISDKLLTCSSQIETFENDVAKKENDIEITQNNHNTGITDIEILREKLKDFHADIARFNSNIAVFENDIKHNTEQINNNKSSLESDFSSAEQLKIIENNFKTELGELLNIVSENQKIVNGFVKKYEQLNAINTDKEELLKQKNAKIQEYRNIEKNNEDLHLEQRDKARKIQFIKDMNDNLEGFYQSTKTILQGGINGVFGSVAELIEVDSNYILAIETALGGALQNIVVDNENTAKYCINFLKQKRAGRATFLPLTSISGTESDFSRISGMKGFIGNASDLVRCDRRFDDIIVYLLGRILVAETLDYATEIAKYSNYKFRIVTLDGQVINAGGSFTGGSAAKSTGLLSRKTEVETLQKQILQLREKRHNNDDIISKIKEEIQDIETGIELSEISERENNQNKNDLIEKIANAKAEVTTSSKDYEVKKSQYDDFLKSIDDTEQRKKNIQRIITDLENNTLDRKKSIENMLNLISNVEKNILEQNKKISVLNEKNKEFEDKISKLRLQIKSIEYDKQSLIKEKTRLEERITTHQENIDNIIIRLSEDYNLTVSEAVEVAKPIENAAKVQSEINALKNKIRDLGSVNVSAIEEYKEQSQRYEFMSEQLSDTEKSKNELEKLIADITKDMKNIFRDTFMQINKNFKEIFMDLFGGGKAELVLEDEENILECGIGINIAPPGKVIKNLLSLSGGEQSFAAIAIFFAMLRLKPSPFCVLDEIDAALDEARVRIFAKYLRNFTEHTQFILVTHRRGAMEEVDTLYGVTMQEDGVSKILKLDNKMLN